MSFGWVTLVESIKRRGIRTPLIVAAAGATISVALLYVWPRQYESTAVLLLDSKSGMGSSIDLGSLSDIVPAGLLGGGSARESGYSYLQVCQSASLLGRVLLIGDPHRPGKTLLSRFGGDGGDGARRREDGIRVLRKTIIASYDPKANIFRVTARSSSPVLSALIANSVVDELRRFDQFVRATRARDAVAFVRARLEEAKVSLGQAEAQLASFQEANARIGNSPRLLLNQKRLTREALEAEEIYSLLSKQYELAQIQEKKETPVFSTVDPAIPPTKPARVSPFLVGALSAVFCGASALLLGVAVRTPGREPVV